MSRGTRLSNLVFLAAMPFAAATVLGALGSRFWICDLAAHATAQCAQALAVACVLLALLRRPWLCLCALLAAGLAVYRTAPLWGTPAHLATQSLQAEPSRPGTEAKQPLRLAAINLLVSNTDADAVLHACLDVPLDGLVTSELTERWMSDLAPLRATFPHFVGKPAGVFGIGLWSRHPMRDAALLPLGVDWAPAVRAILEAPQGAVAVLGVHTPRASLFGQEWTDNRDLALRAIPAAIRDLPTPRVVLGDCNATRWTQAFREMLAASGLVDTADGAGWQPTWPVSLPAFLRIPIDQVLVEPTLQVRRRWIGPETGSDHLPVYVEFDLPR